MQKMSVGSFYPGKCENTVFTSHAQRFDSEAYAQKKVFPLDTYFSKFPQTEAQRLIHINHFSQLF